MKFILLERGTSNDTNATLHPRLLEKNKYLKENPNFLLQISILQSKINWFHHINYVIFSQMVQ